MGTPKLAIVICSRDRPDFLAGALGAIDAAKRADDQAVFVDSASQDPSVAAVAARFPHFTVVRSELPGLARARNLGVQASVAPLIAFTDDDCRPEPGWAEAVEAAFRADPRVGFVTGRVEADRAEGPKLSVGGGEEPRTYEFGVDPAALGHGANFAVRRAALEAAGGFDELLGVGTHFAGTEDHDAFWRILHAGWIGWYEPAAVVVHEQWRTRRQFLRSQYGYGLGSGAFAVKAMRIDRPAGVRILKDILWRRGVYAVGRDARRRYKTGVAANTAKLAGSIVGALEARRLPVDQGRFVPR
jgi:GT2 family glycosyltransferase